jgi:Na+/H+ antiporter NhaD/arsenite permease-like protein
MVLANTSGGILPMILLGTVMAVSYLLIGTGKVHKLVAAMIGALIAVALGLWLGVVHDYEEIHTRLSHDLGVLGVLVGTSILVDVAGQSGLFQFLAIKIAKRARGSPRRLLATIVALTVLFVGLLTIAPGTLIVVSLALVLAKELSLQAKPYLFAIAVAANSGALATFASGICTLMIGTAAGIPYVQFLMLSLPVALATAAIAWFLILRFYGARLAKPEITDAERAERIATFDEWAMVSDRRVFWRCAVILGATILGFAFARNFGIGLDWVALAGGSAALFFSGLDPEEAVKKVHWSVVLFFVALFVMIGVVEETGLLTALASGLSGIADGNVTIAVVLLVVFTAVTSGIMDNIPVAATLIPVVRGMIGSGLRAEPLWWALLMSANLGGNATPIGSISCVIALHALSDATGEKVGWGEYLKVGGAILFVQILFVLAWILGLDSFGFIPPIPSTR